jgi:hypothetical protein
MIFGLLPLVVLAGIIALVVRATKGSDEVDWGTAVRRFFVHLVAVGLVIVAAGGVAELLDFALSLPGLVTVDTWLAGPVASTLVGLPLYGALMWWLVPRVRSEEAERESIAWAMHLAVVGTVALVALMIGAYNLLDWISGGTSQWPNAVSQLVVWGGVWAWTWWLERTCGSERFALLHVIVGSAIGLGTAATGLALTVGAALEDIAFSSRTVVDGVDLANAVFVLLVGLAAWAVYWLAVGSRRPRTPAWYGYVLLGGVLGGLTAAVVAAAAIVWTVAVWFVGDPWEATATDHFLLVPNTVGALVAGLAVWGYHRSLLGTRADRTRTEVDRIHDLILSGVGLVAATVGAGAILVALIEAVAGPGTVAVGTSAINTLLGAATAMVVGGPVWWVAWSRIQRIASATPTGVDPTAPALDDAAVAERSSPSRRVYLFGLFGVGGLAAVISLLVMVTELFDALFGGQFGIETLYDVRYSLAVLLASAAVAALHWRVYRQDRATAVEITREFPRRITLVGVSDPGIVGGLRDATDARVELWTRRNGHTPPWQVDNVTSAISGHDVGHVLVVAHPEGLEVIDIEQ